MLTANEYDRIKDAITAAYKVAFIDDIEDFTWEVIWAYAQGLPVPSRDRTKDLFDVVDPAGAIGWSAKTLVWPNIYASTCEFVIQRADVIKKGELLGFSGLTLAAKPQDLGDAVMTHWRMKIHADMRKQRVSDPRLALLLKSKDRRLMVPYEEPLPVPELRDVTWGWSNSAQNGLLGRVGGRLKYRWYPNQKQLFEIFDLDASRQPILVGTDALSLAELLRRLA